MNKKVTIKQCTDLAEAVFLTKYLRENGITVENTGEKMNAWTGRYALLSRGIQLRVNSNDIEKAKTLLAHPPKADAKLLNAWAEKKPRHWNPTELLTQCPLCGSKNLACVKPSEWVNLSLSILTLGLYKPHYTPLWICRDCDWDSRRKA